MNTEKTTAVLLCNLGTPDAPTPAALRRNLSQFLSDPRVVEIPRLFWLQLLHGVILRVRPRRSAAKYASVWSDAGSPLAVWTQRQAELLGQRLRESGLSAPVLPAMGYGQPAVGTQLQALLDAEVQRVLVLPLYPQYSAATTASLFDGVADWVRRSRRYPELRFVNDYHDHPDYIAALAGSVRAHWEGKGQRAQHLVMSFHGIPERNVRLGRPLCRPVSQHSSSFGAGATTAARATHGDFSISLWSRPMAAAVHRADAASAREGRNP